MENNAWVWRPTPLNVWVAMPPHNNLQTHVLQQLRQRLETQGCIVVGNPGEQTPLGSVPHLAIGFGRDLTEEVNPRQVYGRLPKPRGTVLMITAVPSIPEVSLFDLARGQLLRKAGHIGIIVEGDLDGWQVKRALWASMAGNYRLLDGPQEDILDSLALRAQAHAGAEKVNRHDGDDTTRLTWQEWAASPVHADIAQAAHALGEAGLIEDRVALDRYGSSRQAGIVLRFLDRAALGEGMRSQLDPHLRVMGITATGGGKVNVSADPMAGHVIPIGQLTRNGYVRAIPRDYPITFAPPSIETHENGMVYLAGALVNAGVVETFEDFRQFVARHFAEQERIDILPAGLQPKALAIDHFHLHPKAESIKEREKFEIVYPPGGHLPQIDFPCGVLESELQLLSALFEARSFRQRGPLDRIVLVVLPGHGTVAISGGRRRDLTDALVHGMEMMDVQRV